VTGPALGYDRRILSPAVCPRHPGSSARFLCDGCGEHLCEGCVEEGHRLLFCRLCGERALPLAAAGGDGPTTTGALNADRKRFVAYSWAAAFGYVFRGTGASVFWSFPVLVVILSLVAQLPLISIVAGCAQLLFGAIVLVILPGALFAVVRSTARGEIELPDWPDFHDYGNRTNEIFEFVLIGLVAAVPGVLVVRGLGCEDLSSVTFACWLLLALAGLVTALIWIPAFGAVGVYGDFWLTLRLDHHWRAVRATSSDFARVLALSMLLILIGQTLALILLGVVPIFGVAISAVVGLYSWFTIAHLVGLWFRRHARVLEQIYRGQGDP
jgi:hypothetical protein